MNLSAYAGVWYEISSTAGFKFQTEGGLICSQAEYSLILQSSQQQTPENGGNGTATGGSGSGAAPYLAVRNSGRLISSPLITQLVSQIAAGNRISCRYKSFHRLNE